MTQCPARKATTALVACLCAALVSGCESSEKVVVDSVEASTWVRCALGQSFVAEWADDPPTQFGGATEAWKDYFCVNEDTGALWWDRLDVMARKYNGSYLCSTSALMATTSGRSISISANASCAPGGSSRIWVLGTHGASRPGAAVHRELSVTPEVFSA
ncbi:hypothetical protein ACE2AJ_11960 [Aquihabitans daechungensis]|uniref:hypothetical protein n=1 Tax=Aquihabitans daechungensis TaxID=1052257 RepID=UPI003BA0482F